MGLIRFLTERLRQRVTPVDFAAVCNTISVRLLRVTPSDNNITFVLEGDSATRPHAEQVLQQYAGTQKCRFVWSAHNNKAMPSQPAAASFKLGQHSQIARVELPQVGRILAIASGKGGVGKSTVTVGLALALQRAGRRVCIVDADVYGPSIPTLLNIPHAPLRLVNNKLQPAIDAHGIAVLSLAMAAPPNQALIWRGPLASGAVEQLLTQSDIAPCDDLLIDLPPGTGDIPLAIAKKVSLNGVIVVTTASAVALQAVERGLDLWRKLNVPLLGVVDNMAAQPCVQCHHRGIIFNDTQSVSDFCQRLALPLLGQIPFGTPMSAPVYNMLFMAFAETARTQLHHA